jgi:N-acetylmuramic acid 6-phosphate etherase
VLLTCNPRARSRAALQIVLRTGAEVIAGSTRLKAAAATRSALAMISTGAFTRLGKVRAGRMVALAATNQKLEGRAVRNVAALAGVSEARAAKALRQAKGDVAAAVDRLALE